MGAFGSALNGSCASDDGTTRQPRRDESSRPREHRRADQATRCAENFLGSSFDTDDEEDELRLDADHRLRRRGCGASTPFPIFHSQDSGLAAVPRHDRDEAEIDVQVVITRGIRPNEQFRTE